MHVLSWKIPTPKGLWYRALVGVQKGLFVTPDVDVTTLNAIKAAAKTGPADVVQELNGNGRSKRAQFVAWNEVTAIRATPGMGTLEIESAGREPLVVKVADRERLEQLHQSANKLWKVRTAQAVADAD